jgi:hypothetical protein
MMSRRLFLACAALPSIAAAPPAAPLTIEAGQRFVRAVNGVPGRLIVTPAAPSIPMLDPGFAARAGLRGGLLAATAHVGTAKFKGRTELASIDLGHGPVRRRVMWFEKPYAPDADWVVGPGTLSEPVVRFVLHAPRSGEREAVLPLVDRGLSGLQSEVTVDGTRIAMQFVLDRVPSVANATAGALIAGAQDGRPGGESVRQEIRLGVMRPVRAMTLARPLMIGPLALTRLMVRVGDGGNAAAIPGADADPDEIVVTARKRDRERAAPPALLIGSEALSHCSSLVFDKPARQIRLSCAD